MRHALVRTAVAVVGAAALTFVGLGAAQAGSASSTVSALSANGKSYSAQALVYTNTGSAWAYSRINSKSGNVASGWMGANGRLFNSGGSLVKEGGFTYNSGAASGLSIPSGTLYRSGSFYSYGVVKVWNGSSYNAHYTFKSPLQNA
ncbi:hypothetical protein [Cellulomonas biazotea]|uniref:Uncharacterized protein n=1 Tax=Cellulomonas biazotea TaxID=1709 RepID=A0A402DT86_9CELL|nr:hypothetical protein [Cellulomonas biazotea]GCE77334.1 hypothetical protein CBZ_23900 [Cellulomonas biazotea]